MKSFLDLLILLSTFSCLEGGRSFVIQPKFWDYKGHDIGFEVSRRVFSSGSNETDFVFDNGDKDKEPILLLNGFGKFLFQYLVFVCVFGVLIFMMSFCSI
jgi:hypothetical protein